MNNENTSFDEWFTHLETVAAADHGSCADADAWQDPYNRGLTPEDAWREEWGDDTGWKN